MWFRLSARCRAAAREHCVGEARELWSLDYEETSYPDSPFRSFRQPGKLDTKPPDRVTREPRFCWSASFAVFGEAGNLLALTESEFRDLV